VEAEIKLLDPVDVCKYQLSETYVKRVTIIETLAVS
jgi:hypothetical protein